MRHFMLGVIFIIFLLCTQMAGAGSGWLIYHERSFKGRVIDAETKEPVEGAVVVAQYHSNVLGPTGSHTTLIDVQEALTDSEGKFFIPSKTRIIYPLSVGDDTSFLVWKPGYKRKDIWGRYFFTKEPGTIQNRPTHTDKGLELKPVRTGIAVLENVITKEERRKVLVGPKGEKRHWRKQKQFIKLIRQESEYLTGRPSGNLYKFEEDK
jgi:hypothetical protein